MCNFQNSVKSKESPFQPSSALCLKLADSRVWFCRSSSILVISINSWLILLFWDSNLWRWAFSDIISAFTARSSSFIFWYFSIVSPILREHVRSSPLYWLCLSINFIFFSFSLRVPRSFWMEICRLCTR